METDHTETKLTTMRCFESQVHDFPAPRPREVLSALALFRDSQVGMGYAEVYQVVRMSNSPESILDG